MQYTVYVSYTLYITHHTYFMLCVVQTVHHSLYTSHTVQYQCTHPTPCIVHSVQHTVCTPLVPYSVVSPTHCTSITRVCCHVAACPGQEHNAIRAVRSGLWADPPPGDPDHALPQAADSVVCQSLRHSRNISRAEG